MKQLHGPQDIRVYSTGANRDLEDEFVTGEQGVYVDAQNMRPTSMDGDASAIKKINGETLKFPNADDRCDNPTGNPFLFDYKCIGTFEVNDNIVEFWADKGESSASLIRVNGTIVLFSPDFPIRHDKPLQIDANESCIGGEIYITDYNVLPMFFNIEDLLQNSGLNGGTCTEKYFDDFNLNEYTLSVESPVDHPVFVELVDVGPGGGLPDGTYQYSIRFSTTTGDRSQVSVATPPIPVIEEFASVSNQYPYVKTRAADPDQASCTKFAPKIRFRITNVNNFDFVEIIRTSRNAGDIAGTPPTIEVLDIAGSIANLSPGEIAIREYTDSCDIGIKEVIDDLDPTTTLTAVSRSKAIRYFNQRLYQMNIEYGSRDIEDKFAVPEIDGDKLFPTIENLGKIGLNDPYHFTYHKPYMHDERYGFGVVMFDNNGEHTFASFFSGQDSQGNDYDNYKIPGRRDAANQNTLDTSYLGTVRAATNSGSVDQTHEVFDHVDAITKTDDCGFKNIMSIDGGKLANKISFSGCDNDFSGCKNILTQQVKANSACVGYQVYHPISQSDGDFTDHNFQINREVHDGSNLRNYNPKGFGLNYFSQGMAVSGLNSLPDFVQSFSVVRTPAAKRVVAQGLGHYALISAGGALGANTTKFADRMWFYSPDGRQGFFDLQDLIDNSDNYEIEIVAPLGFFTEVYTGDNKTFTATQGIDMITYARIIREQSNILGDNFNVGDTQNSVGVLDGSHGYVQFGNWRAGSAPTASQTFPGGAAQNNLFTISNINAAPKPNRGEYIEIQTNENLFNYVNAFAQQDFDDAGVRKWHEPLYIVNIVQTGKRIPEQDVSSLIDTGHYQKVISIIGQSNGAADQDFLLVDERWEDCITSLFSPVTNPLGPLNRFTYIEDPVTGLEQRWVNVTGKGAPSIITILTNIQNNGFHTTTDGFDVTGIYVDEKVNNDNRFFKIRYGAQNIITFGDFTSTINTGDILAFDQAFYEPPEFSIIKVRYDSRIPIRFWGGDVGVGEAIFSPLDNKYGDNGDPIDNANEFKLNVGFPYKRFEINERVYVVNNTQGLNKIQNDNSIKLDSTIGEFQPARIRQLCTMFTCESRAFLPYAYNNASPAEFFPLIHYVMRPHKWDASATGGDEYTDNNLFAAEYEADYTLAEFSQWGFGGFRFLPNVNIDMSKDSDYREYTTKPQVGFTEQNLFCTRVIWSLPRPINVQDSPGIRTFPGLNIFDVSDDAGEIKFAWSTETAKGENLYAITDTGIALLLVDKRIVNELSGGQLATVGTESTGVQKQQWITKSIGMHDEMWRTAAEFNNFLWFANHNSVYTFNGVETQDIGRIKYHSKIYPDFLRDVSPGFQDDVTGIYDTLHNSYWLSMCKPRKSIFLPVDDADIREGEILEGETVEVITGSVTNISLIFNTEPINFTICNGDTKALTFTLVGLGNQFDGPVTLQPGEAAEIVNQVGTITLTAIGACPATCEVMVYSEITKHWIGTFTYKFDRFLSFKNQTFGMRDLETYELNKGTQINGAPIEAFVINTSSKEQVKDKEFSRIRINSDNKPTRVEFFNDLDQALADQVQAEIDSVASPLGLKDYNGFEGYVPRKLNAPFNRMQGRSMIFKIIHNLEEDFKLIDTSVQYKLLK